MYILVLSLITLSCFAQEVAIWNESTNFETDKYFNTTFLGNDSLVADSLVTEEQFQHIEFTTEDGIQIKGLERRCVDASCSVICCAGFLPGRKEGLAH